MNYIYNSKKENLSRINQIFQRISNNPSQFLAELPLNNGTTVLGFDLNRS